MISRLTLTRQNAALRRHLGIELARASEAQADLLAPADPQVPGFELAARCVPVGEGEVGGDFYDWQELCPSMLSLVVGDVMGKEDVGGAHDDDRARCCARWCHRTRRPRPYRELPTRSIRILRGRDRSSPCFTPNSTSRSLGFRTPTRDMASCCSDARDR